MESGEEDYLRRLLSHSRPQSPLEVGRQLIDASQLGVPTASLATEAEETEKLAKCEV